MLIIGRRLSAILLALALSAGDVAVCAGWTATPEARMACCSEAGSCPMHESASAGSTAGPILSQAEADSCCAASEGGQSGQSSSTLASAISLAVLGPLTSQPATPAFAVHLRGSVVVPLPPSHVPTHVLLSVFLV